MLVQYTQTRDLDWKMPSFLFHSHLLIYVGVKFVESHMILHCRGYKLYELCWAGPKLPLGWLKLPAVAFLALLFPRSALLVHSALIYNLFYSNSTTTAISRF